MLNIKSLIISHENTKARRENKENAFLTEIGIKDSSNMINGIIKRNRKKLIRELFMTR